MSSIPVRERQYNDYVVNVRIDRSESPGGPIVVNIFLGDVPPDPRQWEHTSKPGVVAFMGTRRGDRTSRDEEDSGARRWETGQLPLTAALIDLIETRRAVGAAGDVLRTLARAEVGPFLHRNLHWRVQSGQREVPLGAVPSLRVSVTARTATVPECDGEFVRYGPYEIVGAATSGRPGGFDVGVDTV